MKHVINSLKIILLIYAIYFLSRIDLKIISEILDKSQIFLIIILLIFHMLRSVRFYLISKEFDQKANYNDSFIIYYISLALTVITPGGIGQLSRIKLLSDRGFKNINIYNILMIEKITDVLAVLTIMLYFLFASISLINPFLILLIVVLLSCTLIFFGYLFIQLISNILSNKIIKSKKSYIYIIHKLIKSLQDMSKERLVLTFFYTTLLWFLFIYILWLGINNVVDVNFLDASGVFVINSIAVAIPITFSGYGLREIILEFTMYDVNSYNTIAVITLQYTIIYLVSFLIGSLILIWTKYKKWTKK